MVVALVVVVVLDTSVAFRTIATSLILNMWRMAWTKIEKLKKVSLKRMFIRHIREFWLLCRHRHRRRFIFHRRFFEYDFYDQVKSSTDGDNNNNHNNHGRMTNERTLTGTQKCFFFLVCFWIWTSGWQSCSNNNQRTHKHIVYMKTDKKRPDKNPNVCLALAIHNKQQSHDMSCVDLGSWDCIAILVMMNK